MIKIMRLEQFKTTFETVKEFRIEVGCIYIDGNKAFIDQDCIFVVDHDKNEKLFVIVVNGKIGLDTEWHNRTLAGHIKKYANDFKMKLAYLDQLRPD